MKLFNTIFTFIIFSNQLNFFSQEKPNVVMIVLDDLNDFVGVMKGHPQTHDFGNVLYLFHFYN